jgi:hypothetical protein
VFDGGNVMSSICRRYVRGAHPQQCADQLSASDVVISRLRFRSRSAVCRVSSAACMVLCVLGGSSELIAPLHRDSDTEAWLHACASCGLLVPTVRCCPCCYLLVSPTDLQSSFRPDVRTLLYGFPTACRCRIVTMDG